MYRKTKEKGQEEEIYSGNLVNYIQCAARITRHRAASFVLDLFSRIFLILVYQILMILSGFGGPGVHFFMIFESFSFLGVPPGGGWLLEALKLGF